MELCISRIISPLVCGDVWFLSLGPIFVEVSIFHVTKTQVAENLFCLLFTLLEINSLGWFGWEVSEIRWEGLLA